MRFERRRLAALAAVLAVGACAAKPNYLFVDPGNGGVRVELRKSYGVLQRQEGPVPIADCGFFRLPDRDPALVGEPPREIWRVISLLPDVAVFEIRYGVVPPGFTQVTPASGAAPPLEPGRRYVVECTGDAIGVTEFRVP